MEWDKIPMNSIACKRLAVGTGLCYGNCSWCDCRDRIATILQGNWIDPKEPTAVLVTEKVRTLVKTFLKDSSS